MSPGILYLTFQVSCEKNNQLELGRRKIILVRIYNDNDFINPYNLGF